MVKDGSQEACGGPVAGIGKVGHAVVINVNHILREEPLEKGAAAGSDRRGDDAHAPRELREHHDNPHKDH